MKSKLTPAILATKIKPIVYDLYNDFCAEQMKDICKKWDRSFPSLKKAWRYLCKANSHAGWKDLQNMIMQLQQETNDSSYRLRRK